MSKTKRFQNPNITQHKLAVAKRLKLFLKQNYGTIRKAAKVLGTTEGSISNSYLNGRSFPGFEMLLKLTEMGCNIHWLITGENNYSPDAQAKVDVKIKAISNALLSMALIAQSTLVELELGDGK